ncbi:MAG: hypothetical protein IT290_09840 [Deltaproteobacteria bacterium]|nr:hypothetical protein [Deltaproteobacteria bacterium]
MARYEEQLPQQGPKGSFEIDLGAGQEKQRPPLVINYGVSGEVVTLSSTGKADLRFHRSVPSTVRETGVMPSNVTPTPTPDAVYRFFFPANELPK